MRIHTLLWPGILALLLALSACTTHLKTVRVGPTTSVPVAGAPYNLTFTQYTLTVTRRVQSCFQELTPVEIADLTRRKMSLEIPRVKIKMEATAVKTEARDPLGTYVIDLGSLQSFFKTTDLKVGYYDNGALKSVNATVEDKTGEFAVSTAATLGRLILTGGTRGTPGEPVACKEDVAVAVKGLPLKEKELVALTSQIAMTTEQVKQYTALASATGRSMSQADRDELSRRVRKLIDQQVEHDIKKNAVKSDLKLISVVDEIAWPPNGETLVTDEPALEPVGANVVERWVGKATPDFAADTGLYLKLESSEPFGRTIDCVAPCSDEKTEGLKYRMPALGTLMMCAKNNIAPSPKGPFKCIEWEAVAKPELISQLGRVYTLPLNSSLFSSKSITASFSEAGVPTMLGTGSTAAAGKAATAFGGIADAAISVRDGRAGRANAVLEEKIKHIKLQQDYQAAIGPKPTPADSSKQEATALFAVDTSLLNAEVANIEARRALAAIKNL